MVILDNQTMKTADELTIHRYGIPSIVLMERASLGVADAMEEIFPKMDRVVILCGRGNNGGDGLALARHLHQRGYQVEVFLFAPQTGLRGDARKNLRIAKNIGMSIHTITGRRALQRYFPFWMEGDVVVDALFGTGLKGPLQGFWEEVVERINHLPKPVVAVDIPSGLSGDTPEILGPAVQAAVTVTLGTLKLPHIFPPARDLCGEVVVADIGIPQEVLESLGDTFLITPESLQGLLTPRPRDSHKGTFGHVVILAGSRAKRGAASLAAQGAYRAGVGLVTLASVPEVIATTLNHCREAMGFPLLANPEGNISWENLPKLFAFMEDKDAVVVGPGLGTNRETADLIRTFLKGCSKPLVLDADVFTAFQGDPMELRELSAPALLTPHPGELARLMGKTAREVQKDRLKASREAVRLTNCAVLLKGELSLLSLPGGKTYVNPTGNPGMATGGMGDVLSGILGGLFAQGLSVEDAGRLGVFLHGLAGDMAKEVLGEEGLMAGDLLDHLPKAWQWLHSPS